MQLDPGVLDALKNNQRQLDADGCEVGVSRQALEELIAAYEAVAPHVAPANAQTEARASLWVPAKPEHAKIGWTYDFEQTERISRAAYDSTGYEATMEVVEFVMAEADRRLATALAAKDAELAEAWQRYVDANEARIDAEAQLAEANKALEPFARIADDYTDEEDDDFQVWKDFDVLGATLPLKHFRAARRAREAQGGGND